jgi:plasmid stabilization system protein ParE
MSELTRILNGIKQDDPRAAAELLPLVYDELRRLAAHKLAGEHREHTLQPTALVHEAARRRQTGKRGGGARPVDLDELQIPAPAPDDQVLAMDEALAKFATVDARKAELVNLRYFVGMTFQETAEVLGIAVPTAKQWWAYARSWLQVEMMEANSGRPGGGSR